MQRGSDLVEYPSNEFILRGGDEEELVHLGLVHHFLDVSLCVVADEAARVVEGAVRIPLHVTVDQKVLRCT